MQNYVKADCKLNASVVRWPTWYESPLEQYIIKRHVSGIRSDCLRFQEVAVHRILREVFTVAPKLLGSLLLHAGESDQCFQLLDYHLMVSQESAADTCEAIMLGEHASVFHLRVCRWSMGFGRGHDLQCLCLDLLCWAPVGGIHAWLLVQLCSFG